ncbi:hypothetical protein G3N55_05265 [Dissulfurirhabdus thermomarina]|uniref:Uncharacterized protein n=1 Tax=Dissulfurirhabdus thermomarina TaxID=1765737 RepID=A0A6N9TLU8_DISTH|nr:hypothetical protein [Dissulfurirhabdus thermomarina]NDY42252.1 hypothetical protein [Dissulfurirhabdus thermomarina]NMX22983.1 hypothetical protein [Dissulfurirhabdus thermomarina]
MTARTRKLDLRGLVGPLLLLKVSRAFRDLPVGGVLDVKWETMEPAEVLQRVLPGGAYRLLGTGPRRLRVEKTRDNDQEQEGGIA